MEAGLLFISLALALPFIYPFVLLLPCMKYSLLVKSIFNKLIKR